MFEQNILFLDKHPVSCSLSLPGWLTALSGQELKIKQTEALMAEFIIIANTALEDDVILLLHEVRLQKIFAM